ncbi:MAG: membrane protein [Candidatus Kapaibacteriales bacterium]
MTQVNYAALYSPKPLDGKAKKWGMVMLLIGLVLSGLALFLDPERAAFASTLIFMLVLSIGLGSMFFVALEYMTGAVWSVPFRRIAEVFSGLLYIAPIFALPAILIGVLDIGHLHPDMFHWTHVEEVASDPFLSQKEPYLNPTWFLIRSVLILSLFAIFRAIIVGNSRKQDQTGDAKLSRRNVKFSAAFMFVFAIGITLISIDYMMSLEPHWFSTMFGVYYFAGTFFCTMAAIAIAATTLHKQGALLHGVNSNHFYSIGALMFAFTAFWGYIAFSQFMLIAYANIPEETFWFLPRMSIDSGWGLVSIGLIFVHFVIPFAMLIQRPSKVNPDRLKYMGIWFIFAHLYDLYWLIYPTYSRIMTTNPVEEHIYIGPFFSWHELGFLLLGIGTIIVAFYAFGDKKNMVAIRDPKLQRGMDFHL